VFARVLFLGLRLGFLCMLRGTLRFSCVLRGALRFFVLYNITYKSDGGVANTLVPELFILDVLKIRN
jgi:hypothetical protein